MNETITYVGLDVHKETIVVALADGGSRGGRGDVRSFGQIVNTPAALSRLLTKLVQPGQMLKFCYEAGPCGYGIQRQLSNAGHDCVVVSARINETFGSQFGKMLRHSRLAHLDGRAQLANRHFFFTNIESNSSLAALERFVSNLVLSALEYIYRVPNQGCCVRDHARYKSTVLGYNALNSSEFRTTDIHASTI